MVFGKIEYLNLLPFHIFMKRFNAHSPAKLAMEYKKGVPAKVNAAFLRRAVDAAFISSIMAQKSQYVGLGIIAKKRVESVIIIPEECYTQDAESATSNILARVLQLQGKVLIGDKALRYTLQNDNYIDLAELWHKRHNLPFVFALLCFHKDKKIYKKIEKEFLKSPIKIPQYLLQQASFKTEISKKEILEYLKLISYDLDTQAKRGLKKFYQESKKV